MSENIPVPGGIDALASAAGLRETPDRARFVAELTRLLFELPVRERVPTSPGARLAVPLNAAVLFQRAIAALPKKTLSLADAEDSGTRRAMTELLAVLGLRFRERRGVLTVESNGDHDAAQRVGSLVALGLVAPMRGVTPPPPAPAGLKKVLGAVWMPGTALALSGVGFSAIMTFAALLYASRHWSPAWLA